MKIKKLCALKLVHNIIIISISGGGKAMRRKLRITFVSLTVIVIAFLLCTGAQCKAHQTVPSEYGDFYYAIMTDDESGEQYIRLQGLTEQGQQKMYVIVPSEINGIKVRELNYKGGDWYHEGGFVSDVLEKIYIPTSVVVAELAFAHCPKLNKVIMLDKNGLELYDDRYYKRVFIMSDKYNSYEYGNSNFYQYVFPVNVYFANLSFMYNYKEAENHGYYWIDDCDYGGIIDFIPSEPKREGYTFGGWYKEAECINKWNFETDTLPEQIFDEEGKEIYQETKLYAKWLSNS